MMKETQSDSDFWEAIKFSSKNVSWEHEKALQQRINGKLSAREALERLTTLSTEIKWLEGILKESDPEKKIPLSLSELLSEQLQNRLEKKKRLIIALDSTEVDFAE